MECNDSYPQVASEGSLFLVGFYNTDVGYESAPSAGVFVTKTLYENPLMSFEEVSMANEFDVSRSRVVDVMWDRMDYSEETAFVGVGNLEDYKEKEKSNNPKGYCVMFLPFYPVVAPSTRENVTSCLACEKTREEKLKNEREEKRKVEDEYKKKQVAKTQKKMDEMMKKMESVACTRGGKAKVHKLFVDKFTEQLTKCWKEEGVGFRDPFSLEMQFLKVCNLVKETENPNTLDGDGYGVGSYAGHLFRTSHEQLYNAWFEWYYYVENSHE
jgi:hypothetical protein